MHEVLVNRLGGLSLPRKSVVRLTDRPDMTLDVYRGRKTTIQPTNQLRKNEVVIPLYSRVEDIRPAVIQQSDCEFCETREATCGLTNSFTLSDKDNLLYFIRYSCSQRS